VVFIEILVCLITLVRLRHNDMCIRMPLKFIAVGVDRELIERVRNFGGSPQPNLENNNNCRRNKRKLINIVVDDQCKCSENPISTYLYNT